MNSDQQGADITVGEQFARRMNRGTLDLIDGLRSLIVPYGWDTDERKIHAALPHDLRWANGWDMVKALKALRLPITVRHGAVPDTAGLPVLFIDTHGEWFVASHGEARGPREVDRRTICISLEHADQSQLVKEGSFARSVLKSLQSSYASLLISSLVANVIGMSTVFFVILIYDTIIPAKALDVLPAILTGIALAAAFELVARHMRGSATVKIAAELEHQLSLTLLHKLMSLPMSALLGSDIHQQRSRLRQFEGIREAVVGPIGQSAIDLPFLLLFGAVTFLLSPPVAWVLVAATAVNLIFFFFLQPYVRNHMAKAAKQQTVFRRLVSEVVDHQASLRGLGTEQVWTEELVNTHAAFASQSERTQTFSQIAGYLLQAINMSAGVGAGILAAHLAMTGTLSLGTLVGLLVLVWRFVSPLQTLARAGEQMVSVRQSIEQVEDILKFNSELYRGAAPTTAAPVTPPVVLDQLALRLPESVAPQLIGVSARFEAQSITALSGPAMAGKTVLAEMIAGFHAPIAGRLLLNDTDVRQVPVDDLRAAIAFAPQEPAIFYGSIAQNLDFAAPGASEDEMWKALLEAGIDGFVRALPDGLATRFTRDRFADLPYNIQRGLTLAQTFLRAGPIFIFDDPTAGLEREQKYFVRAAIRARRRQGTVLLISNDAEDIRLADRYLLLDQGRLILNDSRERGLKKLETLLYPARAA